MRKQKGTKIREGVQVLMKRVLLASQCGFSFMLLIFFIAVNWYQGSELITDKFEWNYTAKFTKLFNSINSVTSSKQISQLDFFIYSAKHYPIYSALMILSLVYMIISVILLVKSIKKG